MNPKRGILLISCGESDAYASRAIRSILATTPLPIHIHREPAGGLDTRKVKTQMNLLTPFDETLFVDTDTLMLRDPSPMFRLLENRKMPIYMSSGAGSKTLEEMLRHGFYTSKVYGPYRKVLQDLPGDWLHYNSGVILFRRSAAECHDFFAKWRDTLEKYGGLDEPAMFPSQHVIRPGLLNSRWNFQFNWEKPDEFLKNNVPRIGVLHLCGGRKAENYARVSRLIGDRFSFLR